jgi:hypothetical protein
MLAPNDEFLKNQTPPSKSAEALVKPVEEGVEATNPDHQCNPNHGEGPGRRSIVSVAARLRA